DVGSAEVIERLQAIAPLHAVRGNNDRGPWASALPLRLDLRWAGVRIRVLHDVQELEVDPAAIGIQAVVAGHSHKPGIVERGGVLFVNPGSAGPRRFKLPVTVGFLILTDGAARGEIRQIA
ncbi:MAG: metallophosphoesterase family protein, partial [Steroidobacteraceae bacterium]